MFDAGQPVRFFSHSPGLSPPPKRARVLRGGAIFLRLRIEANGRPSQCDVMRSYGDRLADQWTCSLMMERGQFRPATDASGRPVAAWFGYVQRPVR
jgi:protein TonB